MCSVSMVGDQYANKWGQGGIGLPYQPLSPSGPTQQQFDELKKEVLEMKLLLLKAKQEDKEAGRPDCEMEAKVAILKKVAEAVGVSLDDVFGKSPAKTVSEK